MSLWPSTLRGKTIGAVILIALLAVGNVVVIQLLLRNTDNVAATLNLAGKMRMLSQRIMLETVAEQFFSDGNWPEVTQRYADFNAAYSALRDGGQAYGLSVQALPASLFPELDAIAGSWQQYQKEVSAIHEILHHAEKASAGQILQAIAASDKLWGDTEALLNRLIEYFNAQQQRALWVSLLLFILDSALLILGYMLISRRVLSPVQTMAGQCLEIAKGNYSIRNHIQSSDELGSLAQALNNSAGHIEKLLCEVAQERSASAQMQAMFDGLTASTTVGIYMLDAQMNFVYVNTYMASLTGYSEAEMVNHFPLSKIFTPADFEKVHTRVQERLQGHVHSDRYEQKLQRGDGTEVEVEIFGSAMQYQGRPAIIGMMQDISVRKRNEASMRRASLVYAHTSEAMVVTDPNGVVLDLNPAFTTITGYKSEEILGKRLNILSSGRHNKGFYKDMWGTLKEQGRWSGDLYNKRKNGEDFIERLTITTSYNEDGSINSYIGLFTDVTKLRQREAIIWRQAHYDHLTQLPNRQMFQESLLCAIEEARQAEKSFALVFLDLDFFKEVNDTFGHDEGDELLRQVASRLQSCIRSSDLVARLGGDEFILILHNLQNPQKDIHPLCEKVLRAISQPYTLGENTVQISASAGVTFYPQDGVDGIQLLKHADLAMYAAKEKGRNKFCTFDPVMEVETQNRRLLLRDLQQGVEKQEFVLRYQPIVDMRSGLTVKAEALVRWEQPLRGLVSPGDFIPLAEESGLIVPLGNWIFTQAAEQTQYWRTHGAPDFVVSVNVSPVQLLSPEQQHTQWLETLQALHLPGKALVLEITEQVLLDADAASDMKLHALQNAGLQLALDDFGTGYSSLSYLKRFAIDYIKIDRSFVCHLPEDTEAVALCQAIIVMAHQLGIQVVAEGVETQAQHNILQQAECDFGQGFWYSKPLMPHELTQRLAAEQHPDEQSLFNF